MLTHIGRIFVTKEDANTPPPETTEWVIKSYHVHILKGKVNSSQLIHYAGIFFACIYLIYSFPNDKICYKVLGKTLLYLQI